MIEANDLDDLAERMKRGDKAAFREFVWTFDVRIFRMFVLRGVSEADAEELTSNTLSRAVLRIHRYQPGPERGLVRWVSALARNVFFDSLRSRRRELAGASLVDPSSQVAIMELDPETVPQEDAALEEAVGAAMDQLGALDREIVRGRMGDPPVPYRDLAARLEITEDSARKRHERARERLKQMLADEPSVRRWREAFEGTRGMPQQPREPLKEENRDE
jgi:RNA polymerase sigma factor (sigma-70 family)